MSGGGENEEKKGDKVMHTVPPINVSAEGITGNMNVKILSDLRAAFMSETGGVTTKSKALLAMLNDSSLQVLSALDVLVSPFVYDLPAGLSGFKSVDILTGLVHGQSLASCNASSIASLPVPVEVFTTISKDAERLVPFLEFGHRSAVTPKAIKTLCSIAALSHSIGPGNISTLASLGYVLDVKGG